MPDGVEVWAIVVSYAGMVLYWVAPVILWAVLFTRERPIATVSSRPDQVLAYLAYRLRTAGFRVVQGPGMLDVRLGSNAAVKLFARPSPEGTAVSFLPGTTKSGMSTFLVLTILFWTSAVALAFLIVLRWRIRRAVDSHIVPMVPKGRPLPEVAPADEISALLVTGLAEGHRIAAEAFEAQRSRYWDLQGYNVLGAFAVGLAMFFAVFSSSTNPDFGLRVQDSLVVGTLAAIAFAVPISLAIRALRRPHVLRYRDAMERMQLALEKEGACEEGSASTFERLVDASREMPAWVEAVRRAGLSNDPAAGVVLLVIGLAAFYTAWYAVAFAGMATILPVAGIAAAGTGLAAGVMIAAGYVYYRRWKRRRDRDLAQTVADWTLRFEALRGRMEQFLDGL